MLDLHSFPNSAAWGLENSLSHALSGPFFDSLMSGAEVIREHEEGSESAPVHIAHELYKKTAADEFSDFIDSKPAVFKGSQLGEGRISIFTASTGSLFGSKIRGYHTTLMSRDPLPV